MSINQYDKGVSSNIDDLSQINLKLKSRATTSDIVGGHFEIVHISRHYNCALLQRDSPTKEEAMDKEGFQLFHLKSPVFWCGKLAAYDNKYFI